MTGTFVLSLHTDVDWGTIDKGGFRKYRGHFERTRQNIESLLKLLDRYENTGYLGLCWSSTPRQL